MAVHLPLQFVPRIASEPHLLLNVGIDFRLGAGGVYDVANFSIGGYISRDARVRKASHAQMHKGLPLEIQQVK